MNTACSRATQAAFAELVGMRRTPAFPPGFPTGLRVLVVEPQADAAAHTCEGLAACSYAATSCSSAAQALVQLKVAGQQFDLVLADAECLADSSTLRSAIKALPVVLTSEHSKEGDIMAGIRGGAADFLQKPLHQQQLRNIWQHVVRRVLATSEPTHGRRRRKLQHPRQGASAATPTLAAGQPQADSTLGTGTAAATSLSPAAHEDSSAGGGGESGGSLASTTSQHESHQHGEVHGPQAMALGDAVLDVDLESLLDAADIALGNPLEGLASSFSGLFDDDAMPFVPAQQLQRRGSHRSEVHASAPANGNADVRQQLCSRSSAPAGQTSAASLPGPSRSNTQGSSQPVLGHPSGQLPPAALTSPGMVWGLPTRPLQIMPRPTTMPWMHPAMMMPGAAMAAAASAASAVLGRGCCPTGAAAAFAVPAELVASLEPEKAPTKPPIGLQLRKSPSLLDLLGRSGPQQRPML